MRKRKHVKKIVFVAAALVGALWFAATARKPAQAVVMPASKAAVQPVELVETMPIVPAEITEARRGKDWMDNANKTDW